jgi:hypothetical protein
MFSMLRRRFGIPGKALVSAIAALTLLTAFPAGATATPPPLLSQFCETGSAAGQCFSPSGIAADPATGNVYVADAANHRINEFSVWGVFIKAWGWGVKDGSSELQTCTTETGCLEGLQGSGAGQFNTPQGVALDSSGDVYVVDFYNSRVQKFDPEGNFLLMFGGGVDQGPNHPGSLCTAAYIAEGDSCGTGSEGTAEGQFNKWGSRNGQTSFIVVGPGDKVYVGDSERIQRFDIAGNYVESVPLPGEEVQSLAVDPLSGNLYVAFCNPSSSCTHFAALRGSKADVLKLSPAGTALTTLAVTEPTALTTDMAGNLYVVDGHKHGGDELPPSQREPQLRNFTAAGAEVPSFTFHDGLESSGGIATSSACGIPGIDLYVANSPGTGGGGSYVRVYGPPPNPELCPPPAVPPTITAQYATSVDSRGATLRADINPNFWPDATYYVQYGTDKCSEGGCDKEQPLAPGSALTSATTSQDVTTAGVFLDGLVPGTTYHYRFVVQSSGGGPVGGVGGEVGKDGAEGTFRTFPLAPGPRTDCPNQQFRTATSATLPDCRAFEMVSPLDKNGGDVATGPVTVNYGTLNKSSANGNMATFSSLRSFADPSAAPLVNQYLSKRDPAAGWSTTSISPARSTPAFWGPGKAGPLKAFSEDFCSAWVVQDSDVALTPEAPPGVGGLYRQRICGEPGYELLSSVAPPEFGPGKISPEFYLPIPQGFSADGAHTVFRADDKLTANACKAPGIFQTYVSSEEGPLRLVSVLPNGTATCAHSSAGTFEGLTDEFREASAFQAVSADGSRVFWTDSGQTSSLVTSGGVNGSGPGKLYVRLNATQPPAKPGSGCSEAEKACTVAISEVVPTQFWGASRDGAKAIYTVGKELFEFDVETKTPHSIAKGVSGVLGISNDASRVYFTSSEVLSGEGENSNGDKAQAGKRNLFLYEGGDVTFIATVASVTLSGSFDFDANPKPFNRTSRVSPDGLHLAFTSMESLNGYDNTDLASGEPDAEVYLYDAEPGGAGQLRCVSCNPSGARPRGRQVGEANEGNVALWAAARLPGWPEQLRPSRLLSADGSHLFFESFEGLVLADTNGRKDVYEWQRASSPAECEQAGAGLYSEGSGGCISLISSGRSAEDSELIDASDGGADVFFATNSSLLPQDPGLIDVYDARANGGFPAPPVPPPSCEGEACQGPLAPPNDPTPGSSSFEGAGNVKPVAKKKAHKRKHAKKHKAKKRANHKRRAGR